MGTSILKRASGFLRGKGKYAVALAGVLAVTAAGYRMALPGFTLERELVCGLEEHVHTEACFPPPDTGTDGKPDDIGASGSPGADSQPGEDGAAGGADQTEKVLACPFEGRKPIPMMPPATRRNGSWPAARRKRLAAIPMGIAAIQQCRN